MDSYDKMPMVLARIPKIGTSGNGRTRQELPLSRGRVIDQALSAKVLGGVALALVIVAIVPWMFRGNSKPPTSAAAAPAWQPDPPAASAEAAPVWVAPVAATPVSPLAPASPSPMPEVSPQEKVASALPPVPAAAALMSPWPNPAHPTSAPDVGDEPRAGANQTMALRPPEYMRDNYDHARPGVR